MKNFNAIQIIIIYFFLFFLILVLFYLLNHNNKDINKEKVLYRNELNTRNLINDNINVENIKNIWNNNEIGNHMNITFWEMLTYWNENLELINFFNEQWYNILYLYACVKKNKLLYNCPEEWFFDFSDQFSSTWSIVLIKWIDCYFVKADKKVKILKYKEGIGFLIN